MPQGIEAHGEPTDLPSRPGRQRGVRQLCRPDLGVFAVTGGSEAGVDSSPGCALILDAIVEGGAALKAAMRAWEPDTSTKRIRAAFESILAAASAKLGEAVRDGYREGRLPFSATIAVAGDGILAVAHVGRTFAVMRRGEAIFRLTHPQTASQTMADLGLVAKSDALAGIHHASHQGGVSAGEVTRPDLIILGLRPDDRALLCTALVAERVSGQEVFEVLDVRVPVREASGLLVDKARGRGLEGDFGCVAIHFGEEAPRVRAGRPPLGGAAVEHQKPRTTAIPENPVAIQHAARIGAYATVAARFRGTAPFTELNTRELSMVLEVARRRALEAGEVLFRADEPALKTALVVMGRLRLEELPGDGGVAEPGHVLNVSALTGAGHHRATARAINDVLVYELDFDDVFDLAHRTPQLGVKLYRGVGALLAATHCRPGGD